jgi:anti-anti-sigma regulatory factor
MTEIVRTQMGVITYLAPTGPLMDEDGPSILKEIVDSCLESHEINLVIDLAQVPTVTGIIIETLLDIQDKLAKIGGYLKVVNPNVLIKDIFLICSFGDYIAVMDDS